MISRRDEILQVARSLFADQGYSRTSMRDIAVASGVLPGSLYAHFRSKAQMVEEILVGLFDELIPAQEAVLGLPGHGRDRFVAMIDGVYRCCTRHPDELTILHYDQKEISELDGLDEVRKMSSRTLDLWTTVTEQGVADGSLKQSIRPELVMRIVTSSIHGVLDTVRYRNRDAASTGPMPAEVLSDLLMHGLQS